MACLHKLAAVMAAKIVALLITTLFVSGVTRGKEIRPSYHGLAYQDSTPSGEKFSANMTSFFAGKGSSSNVDSTKGVNPSNSASWWRGITDGGNGWDGDGGGRNHVRKVLIVTSLVCGITGGVILVVSGLLYIFKFRKQRSLPQSSTSSSSDEFDKSKLQLVVRD